MNPYTRGYRHAAEHLLAAGLSPAPCLPELQDLFINGDRRGRALVADILNRWEYHQ